MSTDISARRWVKDVFGRPFASALPGETLTGIQNGVARTRYRGRAFLKSPFDVVLYMQLIERLRPATVIEVGANQGGSAIWFGDLMSAVGLEPRVVSVDLNAPPAANDPRVQFLAGNARDLGHVLTPDVLRILPRPWLVSEDSAHDMETCLAVLRFFDDHLAVGDYIVIEDGIVADLLPDVYRQFEDGPNRAVEQFLKERAQAYQLDASLCDFYGHNVTYNPNAWLRRAR